MGATKYNSLMACNTLIESVTAVALGFGACLLQKSKPLTISKFFKFSVKTQPDSEQRKQVLWKTWWEASIFSVG